MASKNRSRIYLGYEDEFVTEKYRPFVKFTTNKIGGKPDPHNEKRPIQIPPCKLCGLGQLLALQVYAPLENTLYHRTLYLFTCINANCWNQNESWTCLRVQSQEDKKITNLPDDVEPTTCASAANWLSGADDWDDDRTNDNESERNGNNVFANDETRNTLSTEIDEREIEREFTNLRVEDPNANSRTRIESLDGDGGGGIGVVGGAVGRLDSPLASAEIEGEESEVVCIDTPTRPRCDLADLLREVTPLPLQHSESKARASLNFAEIFVCVEEEDLSLDVSQHVRDLFVEYQMRNPEIPVSSTGSASLDEQLRGVDASLEKYEKTIPAHGDEMFHSFVSRVQKNPGQIIRYCRDNNAALPIAPLLDGIQTCPDCGSERIFELQVLPTIIPKLRLVPSNGRNFEIEFGTVFVFTCSRSCWSTQDAWKEERVVVQAERL